MILILCFIASSAIQYVLYHYNSKKKRSSFLILLLFLVVYFLIFYSMFGNPPPRNCQMPMITVLVFWFFGVIAAVSTHIIWIVKNKN